ncbi:MAG: LysR family transcriptional regulator [Marinovum algicola]|jgi:DNA-binding transcriptional LysR family regulator|uniref:DNA-binding transcriptional regulator, LysR family n=1 Tax=Marinovum algicola TaxID=42444 RepID=A0A975ZPP3_9RHOB|nr:LysR family transcriptional regulator [Marinovum algicola]SEJ92709.1 DNA-binding transcriptional regulator, LysR family [Marinovum algicola]SLN65977.1 HTH-type transcriptional regulator GbpR [Marinovum algicola]
MIKLQHVEMLLAIEQAGSIRAASKRLGKTQPAVTKALRQAETELGAAIFKRAPSGVAVTEDGKQILRRAGIIQAELRKMQEEVEQRRGDGTGRLNVTVSPLAASRIIGGTIRRFRRRFPKVRVQITGGHEPMAFGPVRDGLVDFVIGPEPREADAAGLSVAHLVETPISVIASTASRWAGETRLEAIAAADWLMIGTYKRLPYLQRHFISRGLPPPDPMVTSDSITSILAMVEDGDFLCTFPGLLIDRVCAKWRICALDLDESLQASRIALVTASERPPTPAMQYFADCVLQVARNEIGPPIP